MPELSSYMCVASTLLFHGSATKYFTRISVNPIIFKIKWGKEKNQTSLHHSRKAAVPCAEAEHGVA